MSDANRTYVFIDGEGDVVRRGSIPAKEWEHLTPPLGCIAMAIPNTVDTEGKRWTGRKFMDSPEPLKRFENRKYSRGERRAKRYPSLEEMVHALIVGGEELKMVRATVLQIDQEENDDGS